MIKTRKGLVALLAVACAAILAPASASALTIPGVPPGTIPPGTIPPEVEAQVDALVAQALAEAVALDVPYVAQASASNGQASAAAVDVPNLVSVGKVETTTTSSKVTVLSVAGQDLLVRQGNAGNGYYTGPLAPIGPTIDSMNTAGCKGGLAATNKGNCIMLLYSTAQSTSTPTGAGRTNTGSFKLAKVKLQGVAQSLEVLPVGASSSRSALLGRCTNISTAFIATGTGELAILALVGPKIKASVLQTCAHPGPPPAP